MVCPMETQSLQDINYQADALSAFLVYLDI